MGLNIKKILQTAVGGGGVRVPKKTPVSAPGLPPPLSRIPGTATDCVGQTTAANTIAIIILCLVMIQRYLSLKRCHPCQASYSRRRTQPEPSFAIAIICNCSFSSCFPIRPLSLNENTSYFSNGQPGSLANCAMHSCECHQR